MQTFSSPLHLLRSSGTHACAIASQAYKIPLTSLKLKRKLSQSLVESEQRPAAIWMQVYSIPHIAHVLTAYPALQGNFSDFLVMLSNIYSKLRGDVSGVKNEDSAQGFVRSTTKYWVRTTDISAVKHHILQHLPVFQYNEGSVRCSMCPLNPYSVT